MLRTSLIATLFATFLALLWVTPERPAMEVVESSNYARTITYELPEAETRPLYDFACEFFGETTGLVACPPQPIVIFTEMREDWYGYHEPGSSLVWLNEQFTVQPLLSTFAEAVAIHEMIHYLLDQAGLLMDPKDVCRNEDMSWKAFNLYVGDNYRLQDTNAEWWEWYTKCNTPTGDAGHSIIEAVVTIFKDGYPPVDD